MVIDLGPQFMGAGQIIITDLLGRGIVRQVADDGKSVVELMVKMIACTGG